MSNVRELCLKIIQLPLSFPFGSHVFTCPRTISLLFFPAFYCSLSTLLSTALCEKINPPAPLPSPPPSKRITVHQSKKPLHLGLIWNHGCQRDQFETRHTQRKNQVLYAESGKEFVDVLLSFLTMPIGTIIRLTAKQSQIGCLDNLYGSLEDLDVEYLQTESCKNMLLNPKNASEEQCRNLVVNIDDMEPTQYYLCKGSQCSKVPFGSNFNHLISTTLSNKRCGCGRSVDWKIPKYNSKKNGTGNGKDGVFVRGKRRYMIRDDLQVSRACMGATLELLKRSGISDATVLEERSVGPGEVLHLLKNSILSKTPLTDLFLPVQHNIEGVAHDLKVMVLDSKDLARSHIEKEICNNSKNMIVRLFVSKSRNKVLYAQVGEEFPDMLFSFLAFPLGSIVKCLGGCTSMGCLDNLYKGVEELGNHDCMKSEEDKALLLDPKLVPYFGSTNQLIQIKELPPQLTIFNCHHCITGGTYITDGDPGTCSHGRQKIQFEVINPKFCDVMTELGGVFMDGPATFMVTDELLVKPLSTISCLSLLNQFNLPAGDLEERAVCVGEEEVERCNSLTFMFHALVSSAKPKGYRFELMPDGGYSRATLRILTSISSTEVSPSGNSWVSFWMRRESRENCSWFICTVPQFLLLSPS